MIHRFSPSFQPTQRTRGRRPVRSGVWATLALALSLGAAGVQAAPGGHGHGHGTKPGQAAATNEMADGEVRSIDRPGSKLTIKHGEIRSIDMPPMTMVFEVRDPKLLDGLQPGNKIRFKVVMDGAKMVVTELQKS